MSSSTQPNINPKTGLPFHLRVERGETQKDVNTSVLKELIKRIDTNRIFKAIDLPCGSGGFLKYIHAIFPKANLSGADIVMPLDVPENTKCYQMDLTKDFEIPETEKYDLITSISGIMMFGNTQNFIENCSRRLETGGLLVLTNDNASTIIDRLAFLFLGRHRQFPLVFEDNQGITQNIPVQEVVRLLRANKFEIDKVEYTSFYRKDLKFLPFILLFAPFQYLYIKTIKTSIKKEVISQMFGLKQYLHKHYIIYAIKK
ncbi:MAG: methyltransferase domain-containing protein [Chitinophagaceae bacterium]